MSSVTARRGGIQASYTIEAALLFPFVLTMIMLVIYCGFFLHDRVSLEAAAYDAALRGSQVTSGEADIEAIVKELGESRLEGELLSTSNVTIEVTVDSDKISVDYKGDFNMPGKTVLVPDMDVLPDTIEGSVHANRFRPVEYVRKYRMIKDKLNGDEEERGDEEGSPPDIP